MLTIREGILGCPRCDDDHVHVDDAYVAGRPREDGDVVPVHVDSHGRLTQPHEGDLPVGEFGRGRRHAVSVGGWCEGCGSQFAFVFTQNKGRTIVETAFREWTSTARPG